METPVERAETVVTPFTRRFLPLVEAVLVVAHLHSGEYLPQVGRRVLVPFLPETEFPVVVVAVMAMLSLPLLVDQV
jgi:hypothetical protein